MLKQKTATLGQNVSYCVTMDEKATAPKYGISATVVGDESDTETADNRFFTEEEARACCEWLAKNEVYPITLKEVLADLCL